MDPQRISVSTFPLVDKPLAEALEIVAAAGYRKVDLIGKMPHLSLDRAELEPAAVRAAAAAHGVEVANLGTYVGAAFASDDRAEQESAWQDVQRAIEVAAELGARSIRGFRSPQYDNAEDVPRIVPWLKRSAELGAKHRVYLGLENHGGGISGNPRVCRDLCARVDSPWFGIIYDPCNLHTRGEDYQAGLELMKDHIVHVHVKDGTSESGSQKTTMLGDGDIDVAWVVAQLDAIGYDGDITLEYEVETVAPEVGLKTWYDTFMTLAA